MVPVHTLVDILSTGRVAYYLYYNLLNNHHVLSILDDPGSIARSYRVQVRYDLLLVFKYSQPLNAASIIRSYICRIDRWMHGCRPLGWHCVRRTDWSCQGMRYLWDHLRFCLPHRCPSFLKLQSVQSVKGGERQKRRRRMLFSFFSSFS